MFLSVIYLVQRLQSAPHWSNPPYHTATHTAHVGYLLRSSKNCNQVYLTPALELVHLLRSIPELLQDTGKLALVLGALLVSRDGIHHTGRTADEHLDVVRLGLGEDRLEESLVDVARGAGPVLGRVVEDVERPEALRVRVLQLLELAAQQDVVVGHVAEHERHLGLVLGVAEDGTRELPHGRDAGAARYQGDVVVLVGLPGILGQGTLDVEAMALDHVVQVRRHGAVGVLLHEEVNVALGILKTVLARPTRTGIGKKRTLVTDGGIRPHNGLLHVRSLVLGQDGARDMQTRDLVLLGKLEAETLGVVVDNLHVIQHEGEPALVATGERLLRLLAGQAARRILDLALGLLSRRGTRHEVVPQPRQADRTGRVKASIGASLALFSGVATDVLRTG